MDDALEEVGRRRADAQAALEAADSAGRRASLADDFDRSAAIFAGLLAKVDEAARSIAAGIEQVPAAIAPEVAAKFGLSVVGHKRAGPDDIGLALVGAALGAGLPEGLAVTTATFRLAPTEVLGRYIGNSRVEVLDLAAELRREGGFGAQRDRQPDAGGGEWPNQIDARGSA